MRYTLKINPPKSMNMRLNSWDKQYGLNSSWSAEAITSASGDLSKMKAFSNHIFILTSMHSKAMKRRENDIKIWIYLICMMN